VFLPWTGWALSLIDFSSPGRWSPPCSSPGIGTARDNKAAHCQFRRLAVTSKHTFDADLVAAVALMFGVRMHRERTDGIQSDGEDYPTIQAAHARPLQSVAAI
jgi:hypothetical protein